MDGQLMPAELEFLADEFWKGFNRPGELRKAAKRYCQIFEIKDLSYFRLKSWYASNLPALGQKILLPPEDRKLHGFFDHWKNQGLLFLNKDDDPPEKCFSLAHELAHFLIEYDRHRKRAIEAMGEERAAEFLEQRTTTNERTKGLLHGVSFGPFPHFLEMDRQSGFHRYGIAVAERNADLLAYELLAPRRDMRERTTSKRFYPAKEEAYQVLIRDFQLPKKQAATYAYDLAEELTGGPSFEDFLKGKGPRQ